VIPPPTFEGKETAIMARVKCTPRTWKFHCRDLTNRVSCEQIHVVPRCLNGKRKIAGIAVIDKEHVPQHISANETSVRTVGTSSTLLSCSFWALRNAVDGRTSTVIVGPSLAKSGRW
jgi:hypothetical protein